MADTPIEARPDWSISEEEKKGLTETPQEDHATVDIQNAVPELKEIKTGGIVGEYGKKDGLLLYHFYKADRKKIFDDTQLLLDEATTGQDKIAEDANKKLAEIPWWDNFERILEEIFTDQFKYQEFKAKYYPEVDSWSVILPEPTMPLSPAHLELVFIRISLKVKG